MQRISFLLALLCALAISAPITVYMDANLRCDAVATANNVRRFQYFQSEQMACIPHPWDPTSSIRVNCSATNGKSYWSYQRWRQSTTCSGTNTTAITSVGRGCNAVDRTGIKVDCTGLPTDIGTWCRQADINKCATYTKAADCNLDSGVPCAWCFNEQRCVYSPPFQPCYNENNGQTLQYQPGLNPCPVYNVCNITDTLTCMGKGTLQNACGQSSRLRCRWCPDTGNSAPCALDPPKYCQYLGASGTFPNYCPGVTPQFTPCVDSERAEGSAWCGQKESAEECNFSDDNVWPCMWCSTLGGSPRCLWTPSQSCSYVDNTYGITIIYGGISDDRKTGGKCAQVGASSHVAASGVLVLSLLFMALSAVL